MPIDSLWQFASERYLNESGIPLHARRGTLHGRYFSRVLVARWKLESEECGSYLTS